MSMDTSTTRSSTVVGVFEDHEQAREAIEALKDEGFNADSISVLSPDKQVTRDIAEDTGSHAGSGAATGAIAGGVLGGLGGWLVGIGALAIPGVGPFIAAGAFATALGGAALGAGVGAIAGALMGMGVPEEDARYYEGEAKAGRTLVTVRADGDYDHARQTLLDHGAYDVESRNGTSDVGAVRTTEERSVAGAQTADRMQLREQELVTRKETVDTGEGRINKDVVTEGQTIHVPVTREVQGNQQVTDTVKREEVRIDRDGDVDVEEQR